MNPLTVVPAYGRMYGSASECLLDWMAGKDFKIWQGPYCSKRDSNHMVEDGYTHIVFMQGGKAIAVVTL